MGKHVVNMTFVVERALEGVFREWAASTLLPAARESKRFDEVKMLKILTEVDPEAVNYAVQVSANDRAAVTGWWNDVAMLLLDDLHARVGQRILFFMTEMEVVE
ncbi:MAG: DUF4286 family protein [Muribaculaceae bacterium]|nr:DUF4286 family protein [Muribaculaceae bacterium]